MDRIHPTFHSERRLHNSILLCAAFIFLPHSGYGDETNAFEGCKGIGIERAIQARDPLVPDSTARGLLAHITAQPTDDLPRLVYADWLEEHSHEDYAQFIRVQIRLLRERMPLAVRAKLHNYIDRLRTANEAAWIGLPSKWDIPLTTVWERGFIVSLGPKEQAFTSRTHWTAIKNTLGLEPFLVRLSISAEPASVVSLGKFFALGSEFSDKIAPEAMVVLKRLQEAEGTETERLRNELAFIEGLYLGMSRLYPIYVDAEKWNASLIPLVKATQKNCGASNNWENLASRAGYITP